MSVPSFTFGLITNDPLVAAALGQMLSSQSLKSAQASAKIELVYPSLEAVFENRPASRYLLLDGNVTTSLESLSERGFQVEILSPTTGLTDSNWIPRDLNVNELTAILALRWRIEAVSQVRESDLTYDRPFGLNPREVQVAILIGRGLSNREIADEIQVQVQSVKNIVSQLLKKMRCDNRTQIALKSHTISSVQSSL